MIVKTTQLRFRMLNVVLLTTICAVLVVSATLVYYDLRSYRQNSTSDIIAHTQLMATAFVAALQFDDPQTATEDLAVFRYRPRIRAAAIYNTNGALFASYVRDSVNERLPKLPGAEGVLIEGAVIESFKRIVENDEILGTAYVQTDYPIRQRLMDYLGIVGAVALAALVVAAAVAYWLQSIITGPILAIAGVARNVLTRGDFSLRAHKLSEDEVGLLVDDFNAMLGEIETRTNELERTNKALEREIRERSDAEEEITKLNTELETRVRERTEQLQATNQELESFCYSVSHDLRAPLRAIDGFAEALAEELPGDMSQDARRYFGRIRAASQRMGQLIEDLLNLSRVSRGELERVDINLSEIADEIIANLAAADPDRHLDVSVWGGIMVNADPRLMRAVMENLLGNAWKFTAKASRPRIEVGTIRDGNRSIYFVRDNGAGFDMAYADKLFGAFQRLHASTEYPGTGIGLATVQRIIHRHGGRIWVDAAPDKGAVFFFTLTSEMASADSPVQN